MTAPANIGALAATARGTILGGQLDCYVLSDGVPVVTHGRISTLNTKELVDGILSRCRPVLFNDRDGFSCTGADAGEFIDRLCSVTFARQITGKQYELAREMLRTFVARGVREICDR